MNVASLIILAVVVVWVGLAVRSAFFGGSKRRSCHDDGSSQASCPEQHADGSIELEAASLDDEKYRLPSVCAGCSKGSCSGCPGANRDIPMPIIHELK